jgi:hypothetical protein
VFGLIAVLFEEKFVDSMKLPNKKSSQWFGWLLPICILLVIGTFLIDVYVPLGVAGGVPYVAPVLLAAFLPSKFAAFTVGTMCSILTVGGIFYSPEIDVIDWKVFVNRGLALFAIWVTAILSYYQNQFRAQREDAYKRIRTLEGILPICMDCKKIRDLGGVLHILEIYITRHSEANFSHGYCPECQKEVLSNFQGIQ